MIASGAAAAIRASTSSSCRRSGWSTSSPSSRAARRHGRRRDVAPAAARAVRAGDDERRPVGARGEAVEHDRGEVRRAEVDGAHGGAVAAQATSGARSAASRSARIARLRWSRDVRWRIRTPSRWSISCWMTRASRPEASIEERLAALVERADAHVDGPLDVDRDAGQRQAALLERPRSRRSTTRAPGSRAPRSARRARRGRRAAGASPRPGWRRARCRARRP